MVGVDYLSIGISVARPARGSGKGRIGARLTEGTHWGIVLLRVIDEHLGVVGLRGRGLQGAEDQSEMLRTLTDLLSP